MAFAAAMGVDFAISGITMAAALLPVEEKPVARIGIGSTELGEAQGAGTSGTTPNLYLYNIGGELFAEHGLGDPIEENANEKKDFRIVDGGEKSAEPEYLLIQARGSDPTCVTYVTVTGASGAQRTWHAGYVKTCNDQGSVLGKNGFHYPSPNTIPDTDFRPGCVWLSSDETDPDKPTHLQAISVHLPSFGFPDTTPAEQAAQQFTDFPQTLCGAPGRMSLYTVFDNKQTVCIPYYDTVLKKWTADEVDEEKGRNEGFDQNFQTVVDGHTLPERKFTFKPSRKAITQVGTCKYDNHKLFKQEMYPGKSPVGDTPEARKDKEAADAKAKQAADDAARAAAEEKARQDAEAKLSQQGLNPNGPPPGEGSFGGVTGLIPADQAGKPVDPDEAAKNLEKSVPSTDINRLGKRSLQQGQQVEETKAMEKMLVRREQLRARGDYCVDQLKISHHTEHSAREVCEMNNSWGPDFISVVEGLYCDMCERELYPLCAHEHQLDCFDMDKVVLRGKQSLWQRAKKYVDVQVWRV